MKKALIFGAGGFVGPYLAREFLSHGYEVYGTDILPGLKLPGLKDYVPCDLMDSAAVETLVRRTAPDILVNLAAVNSVGLSWKIPEKTIQINVCGSLNILEAVRKSAPECRVLLIGSSEEYLPSEKPLGEQMPLQANNPYGISKAAMEQFARMYGEAYQLRVYRVRAFNHTGVGQKDSFVLPGWCRQAAGIAMGGKPGVIRTGNLHVRRDFSDVRDIVHAYRMLAESDLYGKVYNVGSGRAPLLKELLETIISFSGQEITVEQDPALVRAVDNPVICCDNTLIREELGWAPQYRIEDTLKEMFANYCGQQAAG